MDGCMDGRMDGMGWDGWITSLLNNAVSFDTRTSHIRCTSFIDALKKKTVLLRQEYLVLRPFNFQWHHLFISPSVLSSLWHVLNKICSSPMTETPRYVPDHSHPNDTE
jgi:hypothetical protein